MSATYPTRPPRGPWYSSSGDYDLSEQQRERIRADIRQLTDTDLMERLRDAEAALGEHGLRGQLQRLQLFEEEARRSFG